MASKEDEMGRPVDLYSASRGRKRTFRYALAYAFSNSQLVSPKVFCGVMPSHCVITPVLGQQNSEDMVLGTILTVKTT